MRQLVAEVIVSACLAVGVALRAELPVGRLKLLLAGPRGLGALPLAPATPRSPRDAVAEGRAHTALGSHATFFQSEDAKARAFSYVPLQADLGMLGPDDYGGEAPSEMMFDGNYELSPGSWAALSQALAREHSRLRLVNFENCNLTDEHAAVVASTLQRIHPRVDCLEVGGNTKLLRDGWIALLQPLTNPINYLSSFFFGWCDLDDAKAFSIAEQVSKLNLRMRTLHFSANPALSPEAWAVLLRPFARADLALQDVVLADCQLDDASAFALSDQLAIMSPTVEALDFAGNRRIGPEGWTRIMGTMAKPACIFKRVSFHYCDLDDAKADAISKQLQIMGPTFAKLDFAQSYEVSPAGWTALLMSMVRPDSRLKEVDFGLCRLDDDRAEAIGRQLALMQPTVEKLAFGSSDRLLANDWTKLLQPLTDPSSRFEEIDFGACHLDAAKVDAISDRLSRVQPKLKKLRMGGNDGLSPIGWRELLRPITHLVSGLAEVSFSGCSLHDESAMAISNQLALIPPTVQELDFAGNHRLGADGWTVLLQGMGTPACRLTRISFAFCDLDMARASAISEQLRGMGPVIRKIDFTGLWMLSPAGWTSLLAPIRERSSGLEELDLSGCDLDDHKVEAIAAELIKLQPTVVRLKFDDNSLLSSEAWTTLMRPLTKVGSHLQELDLGKCSLDQRQAEAIAAELEGLLPTVKRLDFRNCFQLAPSAWSALLNPMTLADCHLEELSFHSNSLNDSSVEVIAELLPRMAPTIKKLDLAENRALSLLGWRNLLHPLTSTSSNLQVVSFSGCFLDDSAAQSISEALSGLVPTLKKLDVSGNPRLSPGGWAALLAPLTESEIKLEELNVSGYDLDDVEAIALGGKLRILLPSVKQVALGGLDESYPEVWKSLLRGPVEGP